MADDNCTGTKPTTLQECNTDPCLGDTDGDGMPDDWEESNNLDPLADDSASDPDGDGLVNLKEYQSGTDPNNSDSDSDACDDGWEINNNYDPLSFNQRPADINGDCKIDLADEVLALQLMAGGNPVSAIRIDADIGNDQKIGLEEAIYILQHVSRE